MKLVPEVKIPLNLGRTPQGVRGLKRVTKELANKLEAGRTPQGVRGLKLIRYCCKNNLIRRTPQGVRGLKLREGFRTQIDKLSHSARSAWIETLFPR